MEEKLLVKNMHNTKKTSKDHKYIKKLVPLLNTYLEERQLQDGIKQPDMKMVLMVISIHVMILVTHIWIVDSMIEEV